MAQAVISLNAVDNTRAAFASVQKNIKQTGREADVLMRQFKGANFAKSILSGFGLGTGFGILNTVMDKFVAAWKESGEYAKALDEKAKSIAESMRAVGVAQRDSVFEKLMPEAQISQKKADIAVLSDQLSKLESERSRAMDALRFVDPAGTGNVNNFGTRVMSYGDEKFGDTGMGARDFYQMMQERADAAQQAAAKVRLELIATEKQVEKLTVAEMKRVSDSGASRAGDIIKARIKAENDARENRDKLIKATNEQNEADEKSAEVFRMAVDPLRTYRKEMEELARVRGKLTDDQYKANVDRIRGDMVNTELTNFFGDMDKESASRIKTLTRDAKEASKAAHELGWAFASSFEDAVIEGGKLSDVLRGLARDILRIMLRNLITEPLAAGITGSIKGLFGGGKAVGGAVAAGTTYLVGENGPELFTPSSAGSIIPNHQLNQGSSAGGNTYYIDARGADANAVSRIESALKSLAGPGVVERRAVAAVRNDNARSAGRLAYA